MSAMLPKADLKVILELTAANDPNPTLRIARKITITLEIRTIAHPSTILSSYNYKAKPA